MPRPLKPRWINFDPQSFFFMPQRMPLPSVDLVLLTIDELEALRLADLQKMSQEEAARVMNVSRATFGRIASQARGKVADALVHGKGICIEGGMVKFRPPFGGPFRGGQHRRRGQGPRR